MNENQKILTALMLPAFIFVGVSGFAPPAEGVPSSLSGWFAVGVVYVALSFLLNLTKRYYASRRGASAIPLELERGEIDRGQFQEGSYFHTGGSRLKA